MPAASSRCCLAIVITAVALLSFVAPSALATATADDAVAALNAFRAAHGLPAAITHHPLMDEGCARHLDYLALNGVLTHEEWPNLPGASDLGRTAGGTAVLTNEPDVTSVDQWLRAPYHLAQVLDPKLSMTGYASGPGGSCLVTLPESWRSGNEAATDIAAILDARPVADGTYVFPPEGDVDVPNTIDVCSESPTSPAVDVGLDCATSPPPIYVWTYRNDERVDVTSVTLTGPSGDVEVRPAAYGSHSKLFMPMQPLQDKARYRATATNADGTTRTWTFAVARPKLPVAGLRVRQLTEPRLKAFVGRRSGLDVQIGGVVPQNVGELDVTARSADGEVVVGAPYVVPTFAPRAHLPIRRAGRWTICATVGEHEDSLYKRSTACADFVVGLDFVGPKISKFEASSSAGGRVWFRWTATDARAGDRLKCGWHPGRQGAWRSCGTFWTGQGRRSVTGLRTARVVAFRLTDARGNSRTKIVRPWRRLPGVRYQ